LEGHGQLFKIIAEDTFLEGLDSCKNPFDLVENFPLSGILVKINKSLTHDSVWKAQIQDIYNI